MFPAVNSCHVNSSSFHPLYLPLSVVLRVLPQFAAASAAAGVWLYEELHFHHRETLRPLQPEVGVPGRLQRGQFSYCETILSLTWSNLIW